MELAALTNVCSHQLTPRDGEGLIHSSVPGATGTKEMEAGVKALSSKKR